MKCATLLFLVLMLSSCVCPTREISDLHLQEKLSNISYKIGFSYSLKQDLYAKKMGHPHGHYILHKPGGLYPQIHEYMNSPSDFPKLVLIPKGSEFTVSGYYIYDCNGVGPVLETYNHFSNGMKNILLTNISLTDYQNGFAIALPDVRYVNDLGERKAENVE